MAPRSLFSVSVLPEVNPGGVGGADGTRNQQEYRHVTIRGDSRTVDATPSTRTDANTPRNSANARRVDTGVDTREAGLQAAIDRLTRALATAPDDVIGDLVAERRAMREELRQLRVKSATNVVAIVDARKRER